MTNLEHDEEVQEVDAVDNTELPVSDPNAEPPAEVKLFESPRQVGPQGPEMDQEAKNQEKAALRNAIAKTSAAPMGLDEKGLVLPKDSTEAWRVAELFLRSGAIPKQFTNVPQVFMARQFLLAHGLNPEIGIRQCTIINGTLSIWGDLPKAICQRSGLMVEMKEIICDKDYKEISFENKNLANAEWVGVCTVRRLKEEPITRTFTMDEANRAGLLSKTNSVWKSYPKRMLQMRARSLALKDAFPDVLSGIAINEYDFDHEVAFGGGRPMDTLPTGQKSIAEELNEVFVGKEEAAPEQGTPTIN